MLKRLELVGFKSFADKTCFDFAPGVTAVVGPNGSGKSNVVDAVKWVLGEQSAKSLRGGDMSDVIFHGSSTRKGLGMAEVTMTFDNSRRHLHVDSDEVRITRRVYRDGQSEYLVHGQTARLKDVRDLFLGSGAGHDAYGVIEQGKVDALLSASAKDRRLIFEEAAGISRFRSRKHDTLRRLEHVEGDLTRVRDILLELDKQLRTLRLQAAKAQRSVEYNTRLKTLRVGLGRQDYSEITDTLLREETRLVGLRGQAADSSAEVDTLEIRIAELDQTTGRLADEQRFWEGRAATARQQIAAQESTIRYERGQTATLETDFIRLGQQRGELGTRLRTLDADLSRLGVEIADAGTTAAQLRSLAETATENLTAVSTRITELVRQTQADRDRQFETVGRVARLQSEAETLRIECERLARESGRKLNEVERTSRQHEALSVVIVDLTRTDADVRGRLDAARHRREDFRSRRDALRNQADQLQASLETDRQSRSTLEGRAEVLAGLERSLEGLGSGVRLLLERLSRQDPEMNGVVGLVADLLTAPSDVAPLIDLALGAAAQQFIVHDASRLPGLAVKLADHAGRVGFIPLTPQPETPSPRPHSVPEHDLPGTLASSLVHIESPFLESFPLADLPQQLLGNLIVVDDISAAFEYARARPGYRYISRRGELLETDGSLSIGPTPAGTNMLSRKAELRELREQIATLDRSIESRDRELADCRAQADALGPHLRAIDTEIDTLGGEAGTLRDRIREQKHIHEQQAGLLDLLRREISQIQQQESARRAEWESAQNAAVSAVQEERELRERLAGADTELSTRQSERDRKQEEHLAAQLALSRANDRLAGLQKRQADLEFELRQRRIDAVNFSSMERSTRARLTDCTLNILRASAVIAESHAAKESSERSAAISTASLDSIRHDRQRLHLHLRELRDQAKHHTDLAHAHELLVRDLTNRRTALMARIQDDYNIDLSEQPQTHEAKNHHDDPDSSSISDLSDTEHLDPEEGLAEIDELKRKIARLGSVNLEALDELADVERREQVLKAQLDDLTDGQKKLLDIIEQIDHDSRRLFLELMSTVRGHFLELFRKLFGGGTADIVLENESSPLESGIEVTARPPGKELRSISLLSGGERTLTAIALLLALFRSRPSPFCLLDEVDAALDDANTARLAGALREFFDRSQFIIVTHKKRTMAMADRLYGITMQESGVSKQVVVNFEDWPEDNAAEKNQLLSSA